MNNECVPYYEPSTRPSGQCTGVVVGKTFIDVSAAVPGGIKGSGNIQIATAAAGAHALGVAGYDGAIGDVIPVLAGPGMIVPVTAGAPISAGQEIMVGANGLAVPYSDGGAVDAALNTGVVGNNNAITWTAKVPGAPGNSITVTLVNPGANSSPLSVDVNGDDIIVSLATNSSGVLTSTAAQVIAAVLAHDTASQKVVATNTGASSGAGVVAAVVKTNLSGGADNLPAGRAVGKAVDDALAAADAPIRLYT